MMDIRYFRTKDGDKFHVYLGDMYGDCLEALCGISAYPDEVAFLKTIKPDYFDPVCGNCKKVLKSLKKKIDKLVG